VHVTSLFPTSLFDAVGEVVRTCLTSPHVLMNTRACPGEEQARRSWLQSKDAKAVKTKQGWVMFSVHWSRQSDSPALLQSSDSF